jgi:hypothetical protein
MTRDPRRLTEMDLHMYVIGLLNVAAVPGVWWHHSPNGELRHPKTGAKLKRMGTSAGFPDLEVYLPGDRIAYLEFKSAKGALSPAQKLWRTYLTLRGYLYEAPRTPEHALQILTDWGAIRQRNRAEGA